VSVSHAFLLECTRLEGDRLHLECKQDKEGHMEDKIVVRSCVGVKCLKLSSIPYVGYECRLEND
nr:hypothetical protein [Tanacetum cinerariifolium]